MIVNYKFVDEYLLEKGIDPSVNYTIEEAKAFFEKDIIDVWEVLLKEYPGFCEIMSQSGNLIQYCLRHAKTIELALLSDNFEKVSKEVMFLLLREEYIPDNIFDIHYLQEIISNNNDKFSNSFIEIVYSEHNLLYKKLEENWILDFYKDARMYSQAIEKSMELLQTKLNLEQEAMNTGIGRNLAIEESQQQIIIMLKEIYL